MTLPRWICRLFNLRTQNGYARAFQCRQCPENNTKENGCPFWYEIFENNKVTGESRLNKTCGFPYLGVTLIENTKASYIVAEELSGLPDKMEKTASRVGRRMEREQQQKQAQEEQHSPPLIEEKQHEHRPGKVSDIVDDGRVVGVGTRNRRVI